VPIWKDASSQNSGLKKEPVFGGVPLCSFTHIATNTTTVCKAEPGILHSITVNTKGATANVATVYDNATGAGTVIAVIDTVGAVGASYTFDVLCANGITVITATGTAADLTVCWI
jgi:hypothetical protein